MAVHNVSASTDITVFIASSAVAPGDVLLLEDGYYSQSVRIEKNYVRIVAKGRCAVFDGGGTLAIGFSVANAVGVEITGVQIRNYTSDGILLVGSGQHRIVGNHISSVGYRGIGTASSAGNLILENTIEQASDGVQLSGGSTVNFIVDNTARDCSDDGFESFLSNDANNVFVANTAVRCGGNGFEIFGLNNLAYLNRARESGLSGFYFTAGAAIAFVNNEGTGSGGSGFLGGSLNSFAGKNESSYNGQSGVRINSDYSILQRNCILFNRENGIEFTSGADRNLALRNLLECNRPENISNNGADNALIENISVRCRCRP